LERPNSGRAVPVHLEIFSWIAVLLRFERWVLSILGEMVGEDSRGDSIKETAIPKRFWLSQGTISAIDEN
jgi:hypothetical protein